jgi:hypothetical protein
MVPTTASEEDPTCRGEPSTTRALATRDSPSPTGEGPKAGPDNSYVAKRDTDYELSNRLVGQGSEPEVERPPPAGA